MNNYWLGNLKIRTSFLFRSKCCFQCDSCFNVVSKYVKVCIRYFRSTDHATLTHCVSVELLLPIIIVSNARV